MIGSLITRVLVLIFGYVFPAYECFKTVEMNKPELDQFRFWCQYWILVAGLTVCERVGDTFIGWIPMYCEAKLAFFVYLWFPKTKGTTYVYDSFFRPYVAKHETEIDRSLLELRTRAGDILVFYWQRAASYVQTRIFEILQYIASQSTSTRPPPQQGTDQVQKKHSLPPTPKPAAAAPPPDDTQPPPSFTSSNTTSSTEQQDSSSEEEGPTAGSKSGSTATSSPQDQLKMVPSLSLVDRTTSSASQEGQNMPIESVLAKKTKISLLESSLAEEGVRVTRARSRGGG